MNTLKQSSGFAMIEVLLAVVVLAIGLLAGSKMQMLGLNYTQGAQMRSNATMAANDIIDRMRLNPDGVNAGAYDDKDTDTLPADPNCIANGCSPTDLAAHDIRVWAAYFGKGDGEHTSTPLKGATGAINLTATDFYSITVRWTELVEGKEDARSITVGVNLTQ